MRIMAFDTISLHRYFVAAFRILRDNSFVAFEADPIGILVQQLSMGGSVRIMAF